MKYYSDGFCVDSNPSKIGGGFTIVDENENLIKTKNISKEGFTNNEAELLGLVDAMELCQEGDTISTDSQNTILWIMSAKKLLEGKNKKRARKDLDSIKIKGYQLLIDKKLKLIFEPRELNLAGIYNEDVLKTDEWTKKFKIHSKEEAEEFLDSQIDLSWIK